MLKHLSSQKICPHYKNKVVFWSYFSYLHYQQPFEFHYLSKSLLMRVITGNLEWNVWHVITEFTHPPTLSKTVNMKLWMAGISCLCSVNSHCHQLHHSFSIKILKTRWNYIVSHNIHRLKKNLLFINLFESNLKEIKRKFLCLPHFLSPCTSCWSCEARLIWVNNLCGRSKAWEVPHHSLFVTGDAACGFVLQNATTKACHHTDVDLF